MPDFQSYSDFIAIHPSFLVPSKFGSFSAEPEAYQDSIYPPVNREEFYQLLSSFQSITRGNCRKSLLLIGPYGSGKSRFGNTLSAFLAADHDSSIVQIMGPDTSQSLFVSLKNALGKLLVIAPDLTDPASSGSFDQKIKDSLREVVRKHQKEFRHIPEFTGSAQEQCRQFLEYLLLVQIRQGLLIFLDDLGPLYSSELSARSSLFLEQLEEFASYFDNEDLPLYILGTVSCNDDNFGKSVKSHPLGRIFGSVIHKNLDSSAWFSFTVEGILKSDAYLLPSRLAEYPESQELASLLSSLSVFPDTDIERLRSRFVPGIFPFHPYTLLILPNLSQKIGDLTRNHYTFFQSVSPGSFRYFLETFGFPRESAKLHLYTPDYLYAFFSPVLASSPSWTGFHSMVEHSALLGGTPLAKRIVKLTAVLQLANHPKMKPTEQTLFSSLRLEKKELEYFRQTLKDLTDKRCLLHSSETGCYYFSIGESSLNISELKEKRITENVEIQNPIPFLNRLFRRKPFPLKKYNSRFSTDRQVFFQYVSLRELKSPEFTERLSASLGAGSYHYRGDLAVLEVVTENEEDLKAAAEILTELRWRSYSRIITALSATPYPFPDEVLEASALYEIRNTDLSFRDIHSSARRHINESIKILISRQKMHLEDYFHPLKLHWYYKGSPLKLKKNYQFEDIADDIALELFPLTPVLSRSPATHFKLQKSERNLIKNSVNQLLAEETICFKKQNPDKVESFLFNLLVSQGLVKKHRDSEDADEFVIQEPSEFPGPLRDIWNELLERFNQLKMYEETITGEELTGDLINPPCGLTSTLLELLLAAIMGRYRQSLVLFRKLSSDTESSGIPLTYSSLRTFVHGNRQLFLRFLRHDEREDWFIRECLGIFTEKAEHFAGHPKEIDLLQAIHMWFSSLNPLTRNYQHYPEAITSFIKLLDNPEFFQNPRQTLYENIPGILGINTRITTRCELHRALLENLRGVHSYLTNFIVEFETRVLEKIHLQCERESISNSSSNLRRLLSQYTSGLYLSRYTKIFFATDPGEDEETFLLSSLPQALGLGPIPCWHTDRSEEYVTIIKHALLELEVDLVKRCFVLPSEDKNKEEHVFMLLTNLFSYFSIPPENQALFIRELLDLCFIEMNM